MPILESQPVKMERFGISGAEKVVSKCEADLWLKNITKTINAIKGNLLKKDEFVTSRVRTMH